MNYNYFVFYESTDILFIIFVCESVPNGMFYKLKTTLLRLVEGNKLK